jgi:hypothetical protein
MNQRRYVQERVKNIKEKLSRGLCQIDVHTDQFNKTTSDLRMLQLTENLQSIELRRACKNIVG